MTIWSLYVIRTRDRHLYTGVATDVVRRYHEHSSGNGAKYLRGRGPLELVLALEIGERGLAQRAEYALKRRGKRSKEALIAQDPTAAELLGELGLA